MATPVKDIFEPRITTVGMGSFLICDGSLYFITAVEGQRLKAVNLKYGTYLGDGTMPKSLEHLTRDEFLDLIKHTGMSNWSVLSRAEAAAELAKMK